LKTQIKNQNRRNGESQEHKKMKLKLETHRSKIKERRNSEPKIKNQQRTKRVKKNLNLRGTFQSMAWKKPMKLS